MGINSGSRIKSGAIKPYLPDGTLNGYFFLYLIRSVDGWLDLLNKVIPLNDQTKAMWKLMMEEGVVIDFEDIPERFRTAKILSLWLWWDIGRMPNIPKEYWTPKLKSRVFKVVKKIISSAETEEELIGMMKVMNSIRIRDRIPDGKAIIPTPSPTV